MNIDELKKSLKEINELKSLLNEGGVGQPANQLHPMIGKKCIIRTYSAGVHYGELVEKCRKEVILKNARRLWYWKTANRGISLSEVAQAGLDKDSKVCACVDLIWLEAVEIIPCSNEAIKNIEGQDEYKA